VWLQILLTSALNRGQHHSPVALLQWVGIWMSARADVDTVKKE
jgi:hypothetical protein